MAQDQTIGTARPVVYRSRNAGLWILQVVLAGMFFMSASMKLLGDAEIVALFDEIGFGQWFRYLTAFLQIAGAVLLLTPSWSAYGGVILGCVMAGAVLTHAILGGSAAMALALLVAAACVAWGRRSQLDFRRYG